MDSHVKILGLTYIILNIGFLLVAGVVAVVSLSVGVLSGDPAAAGVMGIMGLAMSACFLVLAAPGILAGWGLLRYRPWARLLAIVLAVLNIVNVPLGTILSVYTLWVLLQDETSRLFESHQPYYT